MGADSTTMSLSPSVLLPVLLLWLPPPAPALVQVGGKKVPMNPQLMEDYCLNFTVGNEREKEFYSPAYPDNYPPGIVCTRVLSAPHGHFVQVDFRDRFRVEPPNTEGECQYDYLEIRDGEHGYSPLIKKKHCGNKFPERVVSSGQSLWMRFTSDSTIEYSGFRAVYSYIRNPKPPMADIGECNFKLSGDEVTFGHFNISQARKEHALQNNVPVDCVWTISVKEGDTIYMQMPEYELSHPNECNLNYIQIFDGQTDENHRQETFCGSIAETFTSKTNIVYVRFFAEVQGINSQFKVVSTTFTPTTEDEPCDPEVYFDCEDTNCISRSLLCNKNRNCKFGWDEEANCEADDEQEAVLDMSSPHVVIILLVLLIILVGMCAGMVWNLRRMIEEDRQELAASKASLNDVGVSALVAGGELGASTPGQVVLPGDPENMPGGGSLKLKKAGSSSFSAGNLDAGSAAVPGGGGAPGNGGCYVPDAGFPLNARL